MEREQFPRVERHIRTYHKCFSMCNPLVLNAHDQLMEEAFRPEFRDKYLVLVLNHSVGPFYSAPSRLLVIDIRNCSREP